MAERDIGRLVLLVFLLSFVLSFTRAGLVSSWGPGPNYKNYSVRTTVNITEAYPEILNITCNQEALTLSAGTTQKLVCLVQIRDYNGGDTVNGTNGSGVNATFYYAQNQSTDPDDNNVHYTNLTCALNGTPNSYYVNWTCAFDVWYYANNGSWYVNATVLDTHNERNLTDTEAFLKSVQPLYAINVTDVIDFGEMYVEETSAAAVQANVTNFGNMDINITLYAYGGNDYAAGAGYAMLCPQGNVSLNSERYAIDASTVFAEMVAVSGSAAMVTNITIPQQIVDGQLTFNSTYWRLYVNASDEAFGQCNGTVVFSAESSI